jgi:hypothetical protein
VDEEAPMMAKINYYYKDGRKMTTRLWPGTEKDIKKHAKDTLAIYTNAGAASYEILDEDGKVIG